MIRRLNAILTMGLALLKHLFLMPLRRGGGGGAWLRRLKAEHLGPTPPEAWNRFEPASRCIGCGLCDLAGQGAPVHTWIMGAPREPSDAPLVMPEAARLDALAGAIAQICPARVGVHEIAQIIRDNATALEDP